MQNVITIGKRFVPVEEIAFVEPFDPSANPEFKPEKPFKARVVLLSRDAVLTELTPQEFVEGYGFRLLAEDNTAFNPNISSRVETFAPSESFKPNKDYKTRLKWRDATGQERSRLFIAAP